MTPDPKSSSPETERPPPPQPAPQSPRRFDDPALLSSSPELQPLARRLEPRFTDLPSRHLFTVFGEVDLVPMPGGRAMSEAEMNVQDLATYLGELSRHPIGVRCGPGSQNLCALMVSIPLCQAFLDGNPRLQNTLLVGMPTGLVLIFLRCRDACPTASLPAEGTWFGSGEVVPVFDRGPHGGFLCINAVSPVEVAFTDLLWDALPTLRLELSLGSLARQHGPEIQLSQSGRPSLNVNFWAGFCVTEFGITYDTQAKEYRRASAGGHASVRVTPETIMTDLARVLLVRSQSPGRQVLALHREYRHLRRILDMVKVLGAEERRDDQENLVGFLEASVESCPGGSVTSEELYRAYRVYCAAHQIAGGSETWFQQHATLWLKQRFQVDKSHRIIRDGTARRGFRDLGLRQIGIVRLKP